MDIADLMVWNACVLTIDMSRLRADTAAVCMGYIPALGATDRSRSLAAHGLGGGLHRHCRHGLRQSRKHFTIKPGIQHVHPVRVADMRMDRARTGCTAGARHWGPP